MAAPDSLTYDVAILGLGAIGSAAAYHLARRGVKVLGLDQFTPPHTSGSSHGETRVIREAYFEHPSYVPLVQRAYALWAELQQEAREQLYLKTGGLMLGEPESTVIRGAIQSAHDHSLPHEVLDAETIQTRFPGLNPAPGMLGVLEPRAGILYPEKCIDAHLRLAAGSGADLRTQEPVTSWEIHPSEIIIRTATRSFTARKLIIAAGAWTSSLLQDLAPVLTVERQVLLWLQPLAPDLFTPGQFPVHLWEYQPDKMFYGFPDLGAGIKVAFHHQGEITTPDSVQRQVTQPDIAAMRQLLSQFLPAANGPFLRGTVCLYTNTPDGHFILDSHPRSDRVIIASPCSGHGFKFASAIGELLADLALDRQSPFDLSLFRIQRFTSPAPNS